MAEEPKPTGDDQDNTPNEGGNETKTFTQAELDAIIKERLARERKNQPDPEKLKKFEEWEAGQKSEAEKAAETEKKLQDAQTEAEQLRQENAVHGLDEAEPGLGRISDVEGVREFEKRCKYPLYFGA